MHSQPGVSDLARNSCCLGGLPVFSVYQTDLVGQASSNKHFMYPASYRRHLQANHTADVNTNETSKYFLFKDSIELESTYSSCLCSKERASLPVLCANIQSVVNLGSEA